jgi:hypothetical protein
MDCWETELYYVQYWSDRDNCKELRLLLSLFQRYKYGVIHGDDTVVGTKQTVTVCLQQKSTLVWDVMSCGLLEVDRCRGGIYCLHLQYEGNMDERLPNCTVSHPRWLKKKTWNEPYPPNWINPEGKLLSRLKLLILVWCILLRLLPIRKTKHLCSQLYLLYYLYYYTLQPT